MKKCTKAICVLLIPMLIIAGCNKNNTSKNFAASIKDKSWVGKITYTGQPAEYYSVHFNADNTLEWVQLSGSYTGHWILNDRALTLIFDANTVEIKADISDKNELMNITDNTNTYEVNSGALLANPNVPLDNTVWKGSRTSSVTGTSYPYELIFKPNSTADVKFSNAIIGSGSYVRLASGAAIRIKQGPFVVLFSEGEMKGSDGSPSISVGVTKQ